MRTTDPYVGDADPEGRLARFWSAPRGLLSVVGPAGVGKSRAVAAFAEGRACTYADGGPPPAPLPDGPVVVDPADGLQPDAVAAWVERSQHQPVVLVRRTPTGTPSEQVVFVAPLSPSHGLELLRVRAERRHAPASHLSPEALVALVRLLDGLPRALEAAADWLDVASADALVEQLEEDPMAHGLRAPWRSTWSALEPGLQRSLQALIACRGGFDLPAAAALWGLDLPEALERVRGLRQRGVVLPVPDVRARFDVPVSVAAVAEGTAAERASAWKAHAAYYGGLGDPVDARGVPARWAAGPPVEELGNLEAVCAPERRAPTELALRAAIAHSTSALSGADVACSVSLLQDLVEPAQALHDGAVWSLRLRHRLGFLHVTGGDAQLAATHLEHARQLAGHDPSPARDLVVLQTLAWAHWRRGAPEQALEAVRRSEVLARRSSDGFHEVDALGFQAMVHAESGRFDERDRLLLAMSARATTPTERSVRDVWRDVCARLDDPPVAISPDSLGLKPRLVITTSLGKALSLLWLGRTEEVRSLIERLLSGNLEPRLARTRDALLAACDVVDGAPPFRLEAFRAVLFDLDVQNCPEGACRYRMLRAGALWRAGRAAQAAQQLAFALEEATTCGLLVVRDEFRLVQAVCEAELGGGDPDGVQALAGAQPMRWYAELHAQALAMVQGREPPEASGGARWSQRLLRCIRDGVRHVPAPEPSGAELVVGPTCRWFAVGTLRADLRRKRIARRFLTALLARHEQVPGAALSHEEAIDAGWPGEKMLPESAAARLHTLAWQLRRMGLSGLLRTSADGYALRADVRLRWAEEI